MCIIFYLQIFAGCFQLSLTKEIQLKFRAKVFDDKRWAVFVCILFNINFNPNHSPIEWSQFIIEKNGIKNLIGRWWTILIEVICSSDFYVFYQTSL